jgi:hypothetical protein
LQKTEPLRDDLQDASPRRYRPQDHRPPASDAGYAVSLDLLAFNTAKDVEVLSRRADEAKQVIPPSKDVVRQLLEVAEGNFRLINGAPEERTCPATETLILIG